MMKTSWLSKLIISTLPVIAVQAPALAEARGDTPPPVGGWFLGLEKAILIIIFGAIVFLSTTTEHLTTENIQYLTTV